MVPLVGCVPLLEEDHETGSVSSCWSGQAVAADRITVVDEPGLPPGQNQVLQVQVHAGDVAIPADEGTGKSRAEIRMTQDCGDRYPAEVPIYYSWRLKLDESMHDDGSGAFRIVGQFHHRSTGAPSVSFQLGIEEGQAVVRVAHRSVITAPADIVGSAPIVPGEWIDVAVRAVWSPDPTVGELEVIIDGADALGGVLHAANTYDLDPKVLKLGLYRGPGVTTDDTVFYDDIRIGNSWEQVGR